MSASSQHDHLVEALLGILPQPTAEKMGTRLAELEACRREGDRAGYFELVHATDSATRNLLRTKAWMTAGAAGLVALLERIDETGACEEVQ